MARLRTGGRRLVILGLIIGIGVGAGATALVTARTTGSAFDRIREEVRSEIVAISHSEHPEVVEAELAGIDGIDALYHRVGLVYDVDGVPPGSIQASLGFWDGSEYPAGVVVLDGRLPDPEADTEVMISQGAVNRTGLAVGDELDLTHVSFGDTEAGEAPFIFSPEEGEVVGVFALPRELFDDEAAGFGSIVLSPARTQQQVDSAVWAETGVVSDDPAAVAAVEERARGLGWDLNQAASVDQAVAEDSARPIVVVLTVLALLVFVATAIVGSQALLRSLDAYDGDVRTLDAIGLQRRNFALLDAGVGLFVGLVASGTAVALTILGSTIGALGWAADVDPRTGVHVDIPVLVGLVSGILVVAATVAALAGYRRTSAASTTRTPEVPGWVPAKPVPQALVAFLSGHNRRRAVGGVALGGVGVSVLVAIAIFLSSLQGLVDDPTRYGHHGDLVVRDQYGDIETGELDRRLGPESVVREVTGFGQTSFLVNGTTAVPGVTVFEVKGEPSVSLSAGRLPSAAAEVLVGEATMQELALDLGDSISIQRVPGPDDQFRSESVPPAVDVTIVGSAVLAPISMGQGPQAARLDEGIWVRERALVEAGDQPDPPEWAVIRLENGADAASLVASNPPAAPDDFESLWSSSIEWFSGAEPTEVSQAESAIPLLTATAVISVLAVAALIGQSRLSNVRQNRAAYGLLDSFGFTRRQVLATVAGQGTLLAVGALALGLPLGLVGGRLWWSSFSDELGVLDTSTAQPLLIAGLALLVVVSATAVSMVPAMAATRVRSAELLGDERV